MEIDQKTQTCQYFLVLLLLKKIAFLRTIQILHDEIDMILAMPHAY